LVVTFEVISIQKDPDGGETDLIQRSDAERVSTSEGTPGESGTGHVLWLWKKKTDYMSML
jgi:hypothetical protein